MERVIFNVKPSSRVQNRFKNEFPDANLLEVLHQVVKLKVTLFLQKFMRQIKKN